MTLAKKLGVSGENGSKENLDRMVTFFKILQQICEICKGWQKQFLKEAILA
jgi:hypothetical protein